MKSKRAKREKETSDEVYKQMLELYTMVPPPPRKVKRIKTRKKVGRTSSGDE